MNEEDRVPRAERVARHALAGWEGRVLPRLARGLPAAVLPDHLTALAVAAALGIAACYAVAGERPGLPWLANLLWAVHWLGDSLDGTLARIRRIERPRYGYYIDHVADMVSAAGVLIGLGASPFLSWPLALALLAAYYLLAGNVFLEAHVLGRFATGHAGVGPTELRLLAIAAGTVLALGVRPTLRVGEAELEPLDLLVVPLLAGIGVALAARVMANLRRLARLEPANLARR